MKKYKGVSIIYVLLVCLFFFMIASAAMLNDKERIIQNETIEHLKDQSVVIDRALAMWYKSHGKKYPDNLSVLQTLTMIPDSIELSNFTYSINADKTYNLVANLPTGSTYKSPGSKN